MNFRSGRRDDVDLDITPLIDVVFLLLIFFMVSTTFEHNSEINITLPDSSKEVTKAKPDAVINVGLDSQGEVYINNKRLVNVQVKTIKAALSEALAGLNEPSVIISADAATSHQSVVRVMDAARQLDLVKITFATQESEDE